MMSWRRLSFYVALALGCATHSASAQSLKVGDPAPKLDVKSFVKGEPVKAFEPGKNYVVEFWATWCGPCRTSIPHLTELQKKYPDITFIGVSVFEQDQAGVKPFVDKMGKEMDYRVAVDAIPEGKDKDPGDGAMATKWMKAAGQEGIPTAFIVNKEGKIAWISHPMEMDKPLEKIAAGTWDIKNALEEQRKLKEDQVALQKLLGKLQAAQQSGNAKSLLSMIEEIVKLKPEAELPLAQLKLPALIKLDQQDKALELAKMLEKTPIGEDPTGLNMIAWSIVDPDSGAKPNAKLIQFAVEMARRADEKSGGKVGAIADTLAKALFDSGDAEKAVEAQERAIRLTKESGEDADPAMKDRLEKYKKAAKK